MRKICSDNRDHLSPSYRCPGALTMAVELIAALMSFEKKRAEGKRCHSSKLGPQARTIGTIGPAITSLQLLRLGQELMDEARPKLGPKLALADALRYRDGLMIALTAFAPLRRKNLAALDVVRHFHFANDGCTVVIGKDETKTGTGLEFELPALLLPYLDAYRRLVRPRLNSDPRCKALWLSAKGGALSYAAIEGIFARHSTRRLGFRLRPPDVRPAAATTWAVFSPEQIGVAQELLAHRDARTTTVHYNRSRGIQASREFSKTLAKLRATGRS